MHLKLSANMGKSKIRKEINVSGAGKAMSNTQQLEVSFKDSVNNCDEIKNALKPGLSALKGNSKDVKAADTKLIEGSVDIDEAVRDKYPEDSRWDYVVGYSNEAFFIEVHPAATSNVDEMVKKVKWLKYWLSSVASDLKTLHKKEIYYWIPSGSVKILPGSVQYRKIAANHLQIMKLLVLS